MQPRLRYALRGGEFAFAEPEATSTPSRRPPTTAALLDGANSLLIPVADDGAVPEVEGLIEIREPERIYVHECVSEAGRAALRKRCGERVSPLWPEAFRREHHP